MEMNLARVIEMLKEARSVERTTLKVRMTNMDFINFGEKYDAATEAAIKYLERFTVVIVDGKPTVPAMEV